MFAYITSLFTSTSDPSYDQHCQNIITAAAISYNRVNLMEKTPQSDFQKINTIQEINFFKNKDYNKKVIDIIATDTNNQPYNIVFHDTYCRVITEYNMGVKYSIFVNVIPLLKFSDINKTLD